MLSIHTWLRLLVLLGSALLSCQKVFAGNVLLLSSGNEGKLSLAPHTTFYDPGLQNPDLADVVQIPNTYWKTLDQQLASMALHPRHAIWYRASIKNDSSETQTLILRDSSPLTDTMSSYLCLEPNNAHACKKNSQRSYSKNLQTLSLAPKQSAILLIESKGFHSFVFSLSLQTPSAFTSQQYSERIYFGLLDGILCGLALYSLLIALRTRQKVYFAYYVYGSLLTASFFIHQDFFYAFFGALQNKCLTNLSVIMPMLSGASLAYFIGYHIFSEKIYKKPMLYIKVYISIICLVAIAFLLEIPTIFLIPIYGITTLLALSYFFYLCLSESRHHPLSITLFSLGILLPFSNFWSSLPVIFIAAAVLLLGLKSTHI